MCLDNEVIDSDATTVPALALDSKNFPLKHEKGLFHSQIETKWQRYDETGVYRSSSNQITQNADQNTCDETVYGISPYIIPHGEDEETQKQ